MLSRPALRRDLRSPRPAGPNQHFPVRLTETAGELLLDIAVAGERQLAQLQVPADLPVQRCVAERLSYSQLSVAAGSYPLSSEEENLLQARLVSRGIGFGMTAD